MDFSQEFFSGNRQKLSNALPNSLIVIAANAKLQSSADIHFPFRQDSNFWYLTGIDEAGLVLVIDAATSESTILMKGQSQHDKDWDGETDYKLLEEVSGIKNFQPISSLSNMLKSAKKSGKQISYLKPLPEYVEIHGFYSNPARKRLEMEILNVESEPKDVRIEIARLRQVKQPEEIKVLQKAIDITGETLNCIKSNLNNYNSEQEIEKDISINFLKNGANGHGYEPIIAGGKNAATIHYNSNNSTLKNNSVVLLDVGASVGYYSADISRSWVYGKASKRQKDLHNAVLGLQNQAYDILKPGVKIREYQKIMNDKAIKSFADLNVDIEKFPHGFSHHLGLDVHDAADYESPLAEGAVLTVEPGIYLADEGVGIRIEDNVLITKKGIKVLSSSISTSL